MIIFGTGRRNVNSVKTARHNREKLFAMLWRCRCDRSFQQQKAQTGADKITGSHQTILFGAENDNVVFRFCEVILLSAI